MFKHILVPLDGSKLAEEALPIAKKLALQFDGYVTLVRIVVGPHEALDPDSEAHDELLSQLHTLAVSNAEKYLDRQKLALEQAGCKVYSRVVEYGDVASGILEVTETDEIDAIVMCTRGYGGIQRWMQGSVADKVMRQANCPVVIYRGSDE